MCSVSVPGVWAPHLQRGQSPARGVSPPAQWGTLTLAAEQDQEGRAGVQLCGGVHSPSLCEALGSIHSLQKGGKKKKEGLNRRCSGFAFGVFLYCVLCFLESTEVLFLLSWEEMTSWLHSRHPGPPGDCAGPEAREISVSIVLPSSIHSLKPGGWAGLLCLKMATCCRFNLPLPVIRS